MNLPLKIKQDFFDPESRQDEIIGKVNQIISFLEEAYKAYCEASNKYHGEYGNVY